MNGQILPTQVVHEMGFDLALNHFEIDEVHLPTPTKQNSISSDAGYFQTQCQACYCNCNKKKRKPE
jgi:hypothetical protein